MMLDEREAAIELLAEYRRWREQGYSQNSALKKMATDRSRIRVCANDRERTEQMMKLLIVSAWGKRLGEQRTARLERLQRAREKADA